MSTFFNPSILARLNRPRRAASAPDEEPFTDSATVERNLQRLGSQPFVSNEQYGPRTQPGVAGNMMFREGVDTAEPISYARANRFVPQPESIPVEDAPLDYERVDRSNLTKPVIDEDLSSADPRILRSALEHRRDESASQPRGFWAKIGRHALGGLKGAVQGAARGGGLGMLAGAIGGGVSPRWADSLSDEGEFYRRQAENTQGENLQFKRMEAERRAEAEKRQIAALERQNRVAEINARNIEEDNRLAREREGRLSAAQTTEAQAKASSDLYKRTKDISDQQADVIGKQGGVLMPQLGDFWFNRNNARTTANQNQGGYVGNLEEGKPSYRLPSQSQQDQRKLQQVANESRARGAADFEKYLKMRPYKAEDETRQAETNARIKAAYDSVKADLSGVPTVAQFETAKAKAKELATRASNAREAEPPDIDAANKLQAEADAEYGKAAAYHSQMVGSGGYEDNSSGGWVGVRRKARANTGGAKASPSPRAKTQQVISAADFDEVVKESFGGDRAKATAEAQKRGWVVR
jgi:hypothetical protein